MVAVKHIPEVVVPGMRLGRHVFHDGRSRAYRVDAQPRGALTSVRWERHIPVLDQGPLGSCTGNAAIGAVCTGPLWDALPAKLRPSATDERAAEVLAVQLYMAATRLDNFPGEYPPDDTGSDGLSVAKAAQRAGYINGYRHAMSLDEALTALTRGPVITGVNWYSSFDTPDDNGIVRLTPYAYVRGGHEFVVDEIDADRELIGFTNSWGESWGQGGRAYLSWEDWGKLLKRDGDVTVFNPLTAPTPTPTPGNDVADKIRELFAEFLARLLELLNIK